MKFQNCWTSTTTKCHLFHTFAPGSPTEEWVWLWSFCTILHWAFHGRGTWKTEKERFSNGNTCCCFYSTISFQVKGFFYLTLVNIQFGKRWFKPEEASSLRVKIKKLLVAELHNSIRHDDGMSESSPSSTAPATECVETAKDDSLINDGVVKCNPDIIEWTIC